MKVNFRLRHFVFFILLLTLALGLRFKDYYLFPVGGETADEFAWTYLGSSLLQTGQPTSWSYFAPYAPDYIYSDKLAGAPLVRPALDHPPLFSLLPGFAHSLKNNWESFASLKVIRLPMVFLGTFNVLLVYLVAAGYFRKKTWAYVATMIYATAPIFVFGSRLVVAENLLITWTLLALLVLKQEKWRYRFLALVGIGVLAFLTKVAGLVVPASIAVYGLAAKDKKTFWAGVLGAILGVAAFALYGAFYNFGLMVEIVGSQAGRDLGLATLQNRFFLHPSVVEKTFFDGWAILGLFMIFVSFFRNKRRYLALNIFAALNLVFILLTSGEQTFHGWYDYPLYPLFALAIASGLRLIFKFHSWLALALVWLLLLPLLRMSAIHGGWYLGLDNLERRLLALVGVIPFAFELLGLDAKKVKISAWVLLLLIFGFNIYTILVFNQVNYWEEFQFFLVR